MRRLRGARHLTLAALLLAAATGAVLPVRAGEAWEIDRSSPHPGVELTTMRGRGAPLVVHSVRVAADAPVALRPVLASDAVGDEARGRETTSSMCSRVDGLVCINADYNACPACREPFGGVVGERRVLRSFNPRHEQLSLDGRRPTTAPMQWTGTVRATYGWRQRTDATGLVVEPARATSTRLELAALNVRPGGDGAFAFTSAWAPSIPVPKGARPLTLLLPSPLAPGAARVVAADRSNPTPVPAAAVVVVATGRAGEALDRLWEEWQTTDADDRQLVVETSTNRAVHTSVGGHPVLLREGRRLALNADDPKVRDRHPRTLAGWSASGELFLLTVDGRQPGRSRGVTLGEAQELLLSLGAVEGINLDGGGSSTFVERCADAHCVRNRPSEGHERPVTVALAVVATGATAATATPPPVAPAALPRPPAPPAPAAPVVPEPAKPVAPPAPTSPPAATETPAGPVPVSAPVAVPTDVAGTTPLVSSTAPPSPSRPPQRQLPLLPFAGLAALAWVGMASCTVVTCRRLPRRGDPAGHRPAGACSTY